DVLKARTELTATMNSMGLEPAPYLYGSMDR
ncbi:cytochrome C, partial [Providencia rettgeri]|nr:cytochrome C [Providencia rettgeri]